MGGSSLEEKDCTSPSGSHLGMKMLNLGSEVGNTHCGDRRDVNLDDLVYQLNQFLKDNTVQLLQSCGVLRELPPSAISSHLHVGVTNASGVRQVHAQYILSIN